MKFYVSDGLVTRLYDDKKTESMWKYKVITHSIFMWCLEVYNPSVTYLYIGVNTLKPKFSGSRSLSAVHCKHDDSNEIYNNLIVSTPSRMLQTESGLS